MKNKKILLPLLSSGALASTIVPTLTSCGTYLLLFAESHNMLNDCINRVLPHNEMEIYGTNAAKNFYLSSVKIILIFLKTTLCIHLLVHLKTKHADQNLKQHNLLDTHHITSILETSMLMLKMKQLASHLMHTSKEQD